MSLLMVDIFTNYSENNLIATRKQKFKIKKWMRYIICKRHTDNMWRQRWRIAKISSMDYSFQQNIKLKIEVDKTKFLWCKHKSKLKQQIHPLMLN